MYRKIIAMFVAAGFATGAVGAQEPLTPRVPPAGSFNTQEATQTRMKPMDKEALLKKLQGTWRPEKIIIGGREGDKSIREAIRLVLKGSKYEVTMGDLRDLGEFSVNTEPELIAIDMVGKEGPNQDKTILGILRFDDEQLEVCYDVSPEGANRPESFESPEGSMIAIIKYRRADEEAEKKADSKPDSGGSR
jgi:uncharacterized protein (TIGR03067 family)